MQPTTIIFAVFGAVAAAKFQKMWPEYTVVFAVGLAALGVFFLSSRQKRRLPVLAFDFDEVCVGYLPAFVEFNNAVHGTRLTLDDFQSYLFHEVKECELASAADATERVYEFHSSANFDNIRPLPGALEALRELARHLELHVVTSRQTDIEAQTRACAAAFFPGCFAALHFGNHFGKGGAKISKPQMCADIGAVALIDDSLSYAAQCAAAGLPVFLFGEYGWNRTAEPLSPVITRVSDWGAVLDELLRKPAAAGGA